MQSHNKLQEVIWEITDQCYNNCSYCGSKEYLNKTLIDSDKIITIANSIITASPASINISGGNPLLVSYDTHRAIVNLFKQNNIECKIIINPFNIQDDIDKKILELYDWIGVSVNTRVELDKFMEMNKQKVTVITNFNVSNVFMFSYIANSCRYYDLNWQIQYTMYNDNNDNALYQNEEANQFLLKKIETENYSKLILADNMQPDTYCTAGKHSCGITADGDVINCLSERSWNTLIEIQGNLLENTLFKIWTTKFINNRFGDCVNCCKDITKPKKIKQLQDINKWTEPSYPYTPNFDNSTIVMMYGVVPATTYVYAVYSQIKNFKEK